MKIKTKIIYTVMIFTIITVLFGVISLLKLHETVTSFETISYAQQNLLKTSELSKHVQIIQSYNEILTQSVKNYAFTQNEKWKQKYYEFEPLLDSEIKGAFIHEESTHSNFFSNIDSANIKLVEMEHMAIKLEDNGNVDEAIVLLESDQYWQQKDVYQQNLKKYLDVKNFNHDEAFHISTDTLDEIKTDTKNTFFDEVYVLILSIIFLYSNFCSIENLIIQAINTDQPSNKA